MFCWAWVCFWRCTSLNGSLFPGSCLEKNGVTLFHFIMKSIEPGTQIILDFCRVYDCFTMEKFLHRWELYLISEKSKTIIWWKMWTCTNFKNVGTESNVIIYISNDTTSNTFHDFIIIILLCPLQHMYQTKKKNNYTSFGILKCTYVRMEWNNKIFRAILASRMPKVLKYHYLRFFWIYSILK